MNPPNSLHSIVHLSNHEMCLCVCKPLVYIDRCYSQAKQRILICKYKDTCRNRTLTVYKPYLFLFPANRDAFVLIFQGVLCSFSIFSLELSSMVVVTDQSADRPPLMLLVDAENGGWRCCPLWFSATGKKEHPGNTISFHIMRLNTHFIYVFHFPYNLPWMVAVAAAAAWCHPWPYGQTRPQQTRAVFSRSGSVCCGRWHWGCH